jgi:hypothetical protein
MLAYSSLYFHVGMVKSANGSAASIPYGFYLVLWLDGSVTQIPYSKISFARTGHGLQVVFPGQAGVAGSPITIDQFYKSTNPPR